MHGNTELLKRARLVTSLALALVTGSACSASQDKEPAVESGEQTHDSNKAAVMKKMSPKEQIEFSRQDLASRLSLDIDLVKVSGATTVTWRSGALGCPKPGMSYTDVLVPGIWIVLKVDREIYRYHAVPGGQPFYCPKEFAESPALVPGSD